MPDAIDELLDLPVMPASIAAAASKVCRWLKGSHCRPYLPACCYITASSVAIARLRRISTICGFYVSFDELAVSVYEFALSAPCAVAFRP
jgi:hypothetical protein